MMYRSQAYLDHVRSKSCCMCAHPPPSDPHHFGRRGMAVKADDLFTVPLCRRCHDEFHQGGMVRNLGRDRTRLEFFKAAALLMAEWIRIQEGREGKT